MNVRLLGEIPLVQSVCESGDNGHPIALDDNTLIGKAFKEMAGNIAQQVAIRNATIEPTKKVEIKS